jgi:hypothetical protein
VAFCGPSNALARARGGLVVAGAGRHGASGPGAQGHTTAPGPFSFAWGITTSCLRGAPLLHSRNALADTSYLSICTRRFKQEHRLAKREPRRAPTTACRETVCTATAQDACNTQDALPQRAECATACGVGRQVPWLRQPGGRKQYAP